jgi:hypothetical protein
MTDESLGPDRGIWAKIMEVAKSPIRLFGLLALVCNSVFGICATFFDDPTLFVYSIHMFLGIVGSLFLMALWCPASLYHPKELIDIPAEKRLPHRPWVPTIGGFVALVLYMLYRVIMMRAGVDSIDW